MDLQQMTRLQRVLRNVLTAVGTALDDSGRHLPLSNILVLLDTFHPRHKDVLRLVLPMLPSDIRGDFASLQAARTEEQRKKETESTINWLRSLLSPIVKAIFTSTTGSIDFRKIIASRGIVLVNLRKTDFFSADQRNAIGGLLIHEILSAAETAPRENRVPYYLVVDEARLFIGEDMMEALDQARKFKLSICLAGQHLSQFKTDEFDMTPSILNNCGTVACFQQKHPDDLKLWREYFGYANLSFDKHFQLMDRPDGFDFFTTMDSTTSETKGTNLSVGVSNSKTDGSSASVNSSHSTHESESHHHGTSRTTSEYESVGTSQSTGTGLSYGQSPMIIGGKLHSMVDTVGINDTDGSSQNASRGRGTSIGESESHGRTRGVSTTAGETHGKNQSETIGQNASLGVSETEGTSRTRRLVHLPRTREHREESPSLLNSVDDQFHRFAHLQRTLPQRHALVSLAGQKDSFIIRVGDVQPAYAENYAAKIDAMKQRIYATHPYYFKPDLSPKEQDRRLDEFLAAAGVDRPRDKPLNHHEGEKPPFGV